MAGSERASLTIARLFLVMAVYSCCKCNLQLTMDRSWENDYCGYLHCWYQDNPDINITTISDIRLYDITLPDVRKQIATVKNDGLGIKINPSSIKNVTGNGSIVDLNASLSVSFRSPQDCQLSSFLCELGCVNINNQRETIGLESKANPIDQCDCGSVNSQLFKMSTQLSALRQDITNLSTELSAVRQDKTNLSTELSAVRQDNTNLSTELSAVKQDNTNLSTELSAVRLENTNLTTELSSLRSFNRDLSTELSAIRIQYSILQLQFQNLSNQVSPTQTVTTTSPATTRITTPALVSGCSRGMSHSIPRVKFLLWGQIPALCDTETDGGGWVIFQRRTKGDVDFYKDWQSYKTGFGTQDTDFWLGNDVIHNLTLRGYSELRVDMISNKKQLYAQYDVFAVSNEEQNYRLTVAGYRGTAEDRLTYHNNMMFSTYDQDNDKFAGNCAIVYHGAWWYNNCAFSNLNGPWGVNNESGIIWSLHSNTITFTEMKVRLWKI